MQTFTAVILNIVYPGAGYLYLHNSERRPIAIFLASLWTTFMIFLLYQLVRAMLSGNYSMFQGEMGFPGLAIFMWALMAFDTYNLSKKRSQKV